MIKELHASNHHRFDAAAEVGGGRDREIWNETANDLLVDDTLLYGADFPPLPDFPCMSSSSSTSSTPAPVKPMTTSSCSSATSSSAASWAVLKSDAEEDRRQAATQAAALSSTASMEFSQPPDRDCMDVMESFEYMDLIENSNDLFDPCSLFQHVDYPPEDFQVPDLKDHGNQEQYPREDFASADGYFHPPQQQQYHQDDQEFMMMPIYDNNNEKKTAELTQLGDNNRESEDLGSVFLDWLKNNKETVCAEDLRKVKIKKATIECAAKRLGGGKEAMKQLLKLILEWVQSNHLQKRRSKEADIDSPFQNPNPNPLHQEPNSFSWNVPEHTAAMAPAPVVGYMGDPYGNAPQPHQYGSVGQDNYHMLDSAQTWPASQFSIQASTYNSFPDQTHPHQFMDGFGNQYGQYQYLHGNGEKLARLGSSATKEARKKRMARQRRLFAHHRSHHHHQNNADTISQHNQGPDQLHARPGGENCTSVGQANPGNWMYHWPAGLGLPLPVDGHKAGLAQPKQNPTNDRRQGWKPEKNLRFLLQKVLKQSDVGNLGRIVLPKKEAETHLPELEARDGIAISMEDIGTSRVWNMRYRFWPNNKSRMYLLENTGDFVRTNGLQEGDFIVIYSDVKCGKYLIRGVKVRQPGPKCETKRPAKSQRNQQCASPVGNGSTSSQPTK